MPLILKKVGLESQAIVQEVLDDCPTFFQNVEGVTRRSDAAVHELTFAPPGHTLEQKHSLLVFEAKNAIGFVDLLNGYPTKGTAVIGLFVIRESHQKKQLGRQAYLVVDSYVQDVLHCTKIRLAVNDTNPVIGFWEKMGFVATGEKKPYQGLAKKSEILVMERSF